jgi:hypothetical protein
MSEYERPEWMKDLGLWPRFPMPQIKGAAKVERHLEPRASEKLVADYQAVTNDTQGREALDQLRGMILDAMTANRITPWQASRLITEILLKIEGKEAVGMRRIMPDGTDEPLRIGGSHGR